MSPDVLPLCPVEAGIAATEPQFAPGDHARLIDRDELARRLTIGTSTLDRLRAAGRIGPCQVKVGGAVRFRLAEAVAWLSTPTPSGELHDSEIWPPIWAAIQRRAEK